MYTSAHASVCICTCMVMDVYEAAEILLSLCEMVLRREALRNKGGDGMMIL